jgi:4-hydroxybenzoyl-CoA thioesterase
MRFSRQRRIRFSQCDPGGIVYFVHFFDMVSGTVEDWFTEALGLPYHDVHVGGRVGFPIVNTQCEFAKPCHFGDLLDIELAVARLGASSIEFSVAGAVAGEAKFRGRHKVAMMSLDTLKAVRIPDEMREKMAPFVTP